MKLGIMQPYFFPYLAYWQLINAVDKYIVYDDVNFIKNGWINRNNILLNNERHIFTIPLQGASPFLPINKINFTKDEIKKKKLLKTLKSAYHAAPFFNEIYDILQNVILIDSDRIIDLLKLQFELLCGYLDIRTPIVYSSDLDKDLSVIGEARVIDLCARNGADTYINAIGGMNLYSHANFANNNIRLNFLKSRQIHYQQFGNDFQPNLSIIDVMMFNSRQQIKNFLDEYELI